MTDREKINSLAKQVYDYAEKIIALKQENYELKQQIAEFEKPKKKRKFKFMTNREFCNKHKYCFTCSGFKGNVNSCRKFMTNGITNIAPYKTEGGKYILVEVKE